MSREQAGAGRLISTGSLNPGEAINVSATDVLLAKVESVDFRSSDDELKQGPLRSIASVTGNRETWLAHREKSEIEANDFPHTTPQEHVMRTSAA